MSTKKDAAAHFGMSPEELRERLDRALDQIGIGDCLEPFEVEHAASGDALPKHRNDHVSGCEACQALLAVARD